MLFTINTKHNPFADTHSTFCWTWYTCKLLKISASNDTVMYLFIIKLKDMRYNLNNNYIIILLLTKSISLQ